MRHICDCRVELVAQRLVFSNNQLYSLYVSVGGLPDQFVGITA